MALLLFEGFDLYTSGDSDSTQTGAKWTAGVAYIRDGIDSRFATGKCIQTVNGGSGLYKDLGSTPNRLICGIAVHRIAGNWNVPSRIITFVDGVTDQVTITVEVDGSIAIRRGGEGGTIVLQTPAGLVSSKSGFGQPSPYDFWEFDVTVDPTVGAATIWRNEVQVATGTGLNTRATSNSQMTRVVIGYGAGNYYTLLDDFYLLDTTGSAPWNARLGDVRVCAIVPDSAGSSTQLTPSTGSNWQNVDEIGPDDDATYNKTDVIGNKDLYNVTSLPGLGASTIYAVAHTTRWRKDDSGTRSGAQLLKSGATEVQGSDVALPTAYSNVTTYFTVDPNTNAAWTNSAIDALQIGVKLTV